MGGYRLRTACSRTLAALLAACVFAAGAQSGAGDVVFVPTPQVVVERMLEMARVSRSDFVIDLGSGDGRVVITAAKKHGARGLGVDLDPGLVERAGKNAEREGVTERAQFFRRNMFETDVSRATVVTMYLLPNLNVRLRPKLLRELKPGARVVSHDYHMDDWLPDASATLKVPEKTVGTRGVSYVYLWIVPANVGGLWQLKITGPEGELSAELAIVQAFQKIDGVLKTGARSRQFSAARLRGERIGFTVTDEGGALRRDFSGRVQRDTMGGEVRVSHDGRESVEHWEAVRLSRPWPFDQRR
ncbi:MAG: class I SAM-dependent methyltransferase [Betaproteobacteria bacterium]|nr:class I SAM-dependent methyltransferase [Betaproteobacteria bacterium]